MYAEDFSQNMRGEVLSLTSAAPHFLTRWPPATVPVLGCSSLEESYPSLANQSSSGAIQGNVKLVSEREALLFEKVSFLLLCIFMPCGFYAQHLS